MMKYIILNDDGTFNCEISGNQLIEWSPTHYCSADSLTSEEALLFRVFPLIETPVPSFNSSTHKCDKVGVEFINGEWCYKWEIINLTLEEITTNLEKVKVNRLIQINNDDNKIYADVIGNKTTEYLKAAEDARAYKAAGYPEDNVPDYVQSWADAKLWAARQACDDILLQEMMWQGAAKLIRDYRLKAKEAVKRATSIEEVEAAMLIWNKFVSNIRTQLGVG